MKKRNNSLQHWTVGSVCGVYLPLLIFALLCLMPFVMVVSTSFSESDLIEEFGCSFFPRGWSIDAYKTIFIYPDQILNCYLNSIVITIVGSVLNVFLTITVAYPISKLDFKFRIAITFVMFLTTAFGAGLVPQYILYKSYLHIYNSWWVLILPQCASVGHIIFLRIFFQAVDGAYYEAAKIEGANEFTVMFRIATPLVAPGVATVAFYSVLMYWNDATSALYFLDTDSKFMPISVYITRMSQLIVFLREVKAGVYPGISLGNMDIPEYTLQMAVVVVSVAPMLFVFSFFQKYFVSGLTTGGVK